MAWLDYKVPPPIVGGLTAAAMWAVAPLGPKLSMGVLPSRVAIIVLVVVGTAFDLFALAHFHISRTTVNPLKPERASTLVTGGVYRISRNPMYVGLACLLLAWAVYLSALLPFAGPLFYVVYITRFQIQPEERALRAKFGEEYARYAARVRRWL